MADVEQAYIQLDLEPVDRDVTRFLWLKDINKPVSEENIRELRFCRVIWGVVCSAFLLAGVIMIHLQQYQTPVSQDIADNLYADNLVTGGVSVKECNNYYDETKKIFKEAGMNMCKWVSNNKDVMKYIKEEDRLPDIYVKLLGLIWHLDNDTLGYRTPNANEVPVDITKRGILKFSSSPFDLLGLVSPILLKPKVMIQNLWKENIGWDCRIPEEHLKSWDGIKRDLLRIGEIVMKRCINPDKGNHGKQRFQVVGFSDASKVAYAAVIYLKITNEENQSSSTHIIYAKTDLHL